MQRFVATDVFDYYKPSRCARRVALVGAGVPQQETDTPFSNLLRDLGGRHERAHLDSLRGVVDLTGLDPVTREGRTVEAIRDLAPAIYQPRFRTLVDVDVDVDVDGGTCELVGEPDFLLLDPDAGGYVVRDSKLARNISSDRHAGIPLQLQIYGFLFERNVGEPPARLEVHAGGGDIVAIEYEGADRVVDLLREHLRLRSADPNAYEPVGWSKCGGCGYEDRCRAQAVAAHDVALLPRAAVRARELHRLGIRTIAAVAAAVDDPALRDYFWTGKKRPHHKEFVAPLLANARAFLQNEPIPLEGSPALPDRPNLAMFDLEGLPPWLDELDRVYLWGMKVCGERPTGYLGAQAGFGVDGDREGWLAFLRAAGKLFADYGPDLPFVHWSGYERAKVQLYMDRYGDPAGVAARVLANSVDLLQLLKATVVLPLPSYSLKVVDEYVGFERRLAEANGSWSMAKYVEATETDDPATRAALVQEILAYNEEDLDATWAVMEWLRRFTSETSATAKGREPLLV